MNMLVKYEYENIEVSVDSEKVDEYLNNDENAVIYRDTYELNDDFWNRTEEMDEGNCKCFGCSTNFEKLDYCENEDYREMRDSLKSDIANEFLITEEIEVDVFDACCGDIADDAYDLLERWCEKDAFTKAA
jgi:hypothetical protein